MIACENPKTEQYLHSIKNPCYVSELKLNLESLSIFKTQRVFSLSLQCPLKV